MSCGHAMACTEQSMNGEWDVVLMQGTERISRQSPHAPCAAYAAFVALSL